MFFILIFSTALFSFPNPMFYMITLLTVVCLTVIHLKSMLLLSSIISLILVLVYLGAMMVLIGYICAVSPNSMLMSNISIFKEIIQFLVITMVYFFVFQEKLIFSELSLSSPMSVFYSSSLSFFLVIVFMLFLTLIMVTAQNSTTQGPFRSLTMKNE